MIDPEIVRWHINTQTPMMKEQEMEPKPKSKTRQSKLLETFKQQLQTASCEPPWPHYPSHSKTFGQCSHRH